MSSQESNDPNKKVVVMEHELVVDDMLLREVKKMTTVTPEDGGPKQITFSITRHIGDRSIQKKVTKVDGRVIDSTVHTTMTEQERMNFENDWRALWNPGMTSDQAAQEIMPAIKR